MKLALLLIAITAVAQDLSVVRGTVTEFGTTPPSPLVGADIILYEFRNVDRVYSRVEVARVLTDGHGDFSIRPERPGTYFIEAKKATYLTAEDLDAFTPLPCCFVTESPLVIEAGKPLEAFRFTLVRPGALSGRVIDEKDKPVAGLTLSTIGVGRSTTAQTDKDGAFTFSVVLPGPTKVRVAPDRAAHPLAIRVKEDLEVVEEDTETSYWPGGATDAKLALPISVIPGATVNLPTIRIRNAPYYRAVLHFSGGCERPRVIGFTDGSSFMPGLCNKDLLMGRLAVGSRTLAVWETVAQANTDISSWALVPLVIQDHNIELGVTMNPSVEVRGRFLARNSDQPPEIGNTKISLKPIDVSFLNRTFDAQAEGATFVIKNVAWPQHRVTVTLGNPNLVVKEMRYAGQAVVDGMLQVVPGATLDVIVAAR